MAEWRWIHLQCRRLRRHGFNPWFRKIPWRRAWQPTPIFLPGKSHGQRSLAGYSPKCHKELDMTKHAKNIVLIEFYPLLMKSMGKMDSSNLLSLSLSLYIYMAIPVAQSVKNPLAMQETACNQCQTQCQNQCQNQCQTQSPWVWSLGQEDPLEKEMATHSSVLACRIPWAEEPGGLQFIGSQESDTTLWPNQPHSYILHWAFSSAVN